MTQTALQAEPSADVRFSPKYLEARERWAETVACHRALTEKAEGLRLALSLTAPGASTDGFPTRLREKAEPFLKLLSPRRSKAIEQLGDAQSDLADFIPEFTAAREEWQVAQRRETNRIASALQPRQRTAVRRMAKAIEALSEAIAKERAVREELADRAPLPQSPNLPDLSSDLLIGTLADFNGPAWNWAQRLRKLGILK